MHIQANYMHIRSAVLESGSCVRILELYAYWCGKSRLEIPSLMSDPFYILDRPVHREHLRNQATILIFDFFHPFICSTFIFSIAASS